VILEVDQLDSRQPPQHLLGIARQLGVLAQVPDLHLLRLIAWAFMQVA
jgi:hypothetical protein